ncbi:MAG: FtsX-like permease family protein [Anaerolineales bacterium]|nr:FtsX-like permease family protein [Anaerolineales bacterium]MDW8448053.1 FtsX-like permease family protein [Anaerolineales bacterium]
MHALWFIALRNLSQRKFRAFLTAIGVLLGVSVVLAIEVTNQTTIDSLRSVFDRAAGQASLLVIPSSQKDENLKQGLLPTVQSVKGVAVAAPSLRVNTLPADEAGDWQIALNLNGVAVGSFFLLYGIDPALDPQVRVYVLAEGRMPQAGRYEIVLPRKYAEEKKLRLGNGLILLTPQGTARFKITGLLANEGVALINDGVVGFAPLKVVQESFHLEGQLDEIAIRTSETISSKPALLEELKRSLQQRIGENGDVVYPDSRGVVVSQMLATYQLGLSFFSIIAIFVGSFLVYNTFSMTVSERIREIGMLRAIGMSRKQVLSTVLIEAFVVAFFGSLAGIPLGILLARGLIRMTDAVITPSEEVFSLSVPIILEALAVGIGVALLSALQPAIRASRISPLEALRVRAKSDTKPAKAIWITGFCLIAFGYFVIYGMSWPEHWMFPVGSIAVLTIFLGATLTVTLAIQYLELISRRLAAKAYGSEGRLGSANVRRTVGRTTLTVASLMVSLTMIISINSVATSFKKDMGDWIDSALGGDLYVRSAVTMRQSFGNQLRSVPGVAVVTPTRVLEVRVAPESLPKDTLQNEFYLYAIDPDTFRQIADLQFTDAQADPEASWARLKRGNAVFISNVTAERYRLKTGDRITILTPRGKHSFTIAGVVLDFTGQRGVMYTSYQDLQTYFGESGADRFTLKVAPGYSVDQVAAEIESRYQKRRHISLQSTREFKQSVLNLVESAFRLFDVLGLIGILIGALGVVNTLTMNVIERQREIGALRSIGMTRLQVMRMILAEALAHGTMGGIYGLLFGFLIAQVMVLAMNLMIGYNLSYKFNWQPFLIGLVIAFLVAQMAAIGPAQRAARVNIIEAIKHE